MLNSVADEIRYRIDVTLWKKIMNNDDNVRNIRGQTRLNVYRPLANLIEIQIMFRISQELDDIVYA